VLYESVQLTSLAGRKNNIRYDVHCLSSKLKKIDVFHNSAHRAQEGLQAQEYISVVCFNKDFFSDFS